MLLVVGATCATQTESVGIFVHVVNYLMGLEQISVKTGYCVPDGGVFLLLGQCCGVLNFI